MPTQFIWDKDSANLFNQALISSRTQTLIADFINCEFPVTEKGIDEAVESFESILHSAASQSLKRKIVKRRRKNTNIITKKWFDKECRLKRNALRKLANEKHRDPTNPDIRELYHSTQKQYQSLIKSKRNKYQAEKCKELEEADTDSSSFWNTLKSMPDTLEPKQIPPISQDKWLEHFKKLHDVPAKNSSTEQQNIRKEIKQLEKTQTESVPAVLQAPITISEILLRRNLLKNKKAPFPDLVRNEMIKYSCNKMPHIYE